MRLKPTSLLFLILIAATSAPARSSDPSSGLIVPGRIGNAMKFDGVHYLRPPGLGMLDKGTFAVWIQPQENPEQIVTLLNTDRWQRSACHFQLFDGLAQFSVAEAVEIRSHAHPGLEFGKWQHIAASYDSTSRAVAIYVNGALDRKATCERSVPMDLRDFSIGAWNRGRP